ncbi:hydantoinase B/oxoprolinase family protein [Phenylobacterium sp. VNQ135]|uniref:hydantoinase B/oxoprolinase family protein n=1 Tax=Phenylobacterium sp. VNQ135 TaxID=3400922 RepID=UPI003BFFAB7E
MDAVDPVTFSIVRHRLFRIVEEAVITLKQVCGSAITNEGHDLMVSLYRADGSLLMGGVGFLHHLTSASEACKAIIRRFGDDIHPGDLFLLNDPYTAALHTSDVYLISPIHFEGQLVAWSACFVHVFDIGAMTPGGFVPQARDVFNEGFSSPGLKLIDRGTLRQDVWDTILNMVRGPEMVALDLRSMIACNNVARERITALVGKYGADAFDAICGTLIDQSERRLRARLAALPDGTWRARQYFDVEGETYRVVLALTKQGDSLTFDFTGSSPQSDYPVNCTQWATLGGLFAPLFPLLCHDITWNEGVIRPVSMIVPAASIVACERPAPISVATVAAIQSVNNVAGSVISKMLVASPHERGEASAGWHGNHFVMFTLGVNQQGNYAIGVLTESFAGAGGARTFADGVDLGGELPNPISRMANVESTEAEVPVRYLFRRRRPDSGGPGLYRGGTGGEFALVAHDAPAGSIDYIVVGKGVGFPQSDGLSGGLPGAGNDYLHFSVGEAEANGGAVSLSGLMGEPSRVPWGTHVLRDGEVLYVGWNGGGGFGDPLHRAPEQVMADVSTGLVSETAARRSYGVIVRDGAVDAEATQALRAERLTGAASPSAAAAGVIWRPSGVCCAGCDRPVAGPGAPWKAGARLRVTAVSELPGAPSSLDPRVVLRTFECPSCGLLLDTEIALPEDPFVDDVVTPVDAPKVAA